MNRNSININLRGNKLEKLIKKPFPKVVGLIQHFNLQEHTSKMVIVIVFYL